MSDKARRLYDRLNQSGYKLPDYDTFYSGLQDEERARTFYGRLESSGYKLPEFDSFYSVFSEPQKETEEPVLANDVVVQEKKSPQSTLQTLPGLFGFGLQAGPEDRHEEDVVTDPEARTKLEDLSNSLFNTWQGIKAAFSDLATGVQLPQYKLNQLTERGVKTLQDRLDMSDEVADIIRDHFTFGDTGERFMQDGEIRRQDTAETLTGLAQTSESLRAKMRPVTPALESIRKGDVAGIAVGAVNGALGYVPSILVGAATGGLGFVPMFAGSAFNEAVAEKARMNLGDGELDIDVQGMLANDLYSGLTDGEIREIIRSGEADTFVPAVVGGVAGMLEKYALSGAKKMITEKIMSSKGLNLVKDVLSEGGRQGFINWLEGGLMHYNLEYAKTGNPVQSAVTMGEWLISEEGANAGIEATLGTVLTGGIGAGARAMTRGQERREDVRDEKSGITERTLSTEKGDYKFIGDKDGLVYEDGNMTEEQAKQTTEELSKKYPRVNFSIKDNTDKEDPFAEPNFTIFADPAPKMDVASQIEEDQAPQYFMGEEQLTREKAEEIIDGAESMEDLEGLGINNDTELETRLTDKVNEFDQEKQEAGEPATEERVADEDVQQEQPAERTDTEVQVEQQSEQETQIQQEDAVQEQTTDEVPLQQEAETGEKVEERTPETEREETAAEEEVAETKKQEAAEEVIVPDVPRVSFTVFGEKKTGTRDGDVILGDDGTRYQPSMIENVKDLTESQQRIAEQEEVVKNLFNKIKSQLKDPRQGIMFDFEQRAKQDIEFFNTLKNLVVEYAKLKGMQFSEAMKRFEERIFDEKITDKNREYLKKLWDDVKKEIPKRSTKKELKGLTAEEQGRQAVAEILTDVKRRFNEAKKDLRARIPKSKTEGVKTEKERINELRSGLEKWIKENSKDINSIGAKLNTAILRKVNNIKTELGAERTIEYIEKILTNKKLRDEAIEKENLIDSITKEADVKKQIKTESGVKKSKRRQTAEGISVLSKISDALGMTRVQGEERIQMLQEEIYNGELSQEELFNKEAEMYAANFSGLEELSNSQLKELLDELKTIKKTDRIDALERVKKWKEQRESNVENSLKTLDPNNKSKVKHEAKKSDYRPESKRRAYTLANFRLKDLLDALSKFDKTSGPFQSWFHNKVMDTIRGAETNEQKEQREIFEEVSKAYGRIFGIDKKNRKVNMMLENSKPEPFKYTKTDGKVVEVEISQNEAYKRYMEMKDETLDGTFERMGLGRDYFDAIEKFLKPEVKEWADWQLNEFYPSFGKKINKAYRDVFGMDMPLRENYSPIFRIRENVKDDSVESLFSQQNPISTVNNGSLKARVGSTLPLAYMDGDRVLVNHIYQMLYFKNWAMPLKEMNAMLFDQRTANAIEQLHGKEYMTYLRDFMDEFYKKPRKYMATDNLMSKMIQNFSVMAMSINPVSFIKQLTSMPAYVSALPTGQGGNWIKGVGEFMSNPYRFGKFLYDHSDYLQNRYEAGFDRDQMQAMRSDWRQTMAKKGNLAGKLMILTRMGDMGAIMAGGWPVYKHYYEDGVRQGMTGKQAIDYGIKQFEIATESAQQASNPKDLPQFFRGGPMYKVFTMFMTTPMAYHNNAMAAIRNLRHGRGSRKQNIRDFFLYHSILPMIFQWASMGFRTPDEPDEVYDLLRAGVVGNINALFIVGGLANAFLQNTVEGKPFGYTANNVLDGFMNQAIKAGRKTLDLFDEETEITVADVMEAIHEMAKATSGVYLPLAPYRQLERMAKGGRDVMEGDTEYPVKRILGWSDWALGENPESNRQRNRILEWIIGKDYKKKKNPDGDEYVDFQGVDIDERYNFK